VKATYDGPDYWRAKPYEYETVAAVNQLAGDARFKDIVESGSDRDLEEWIESWDAGDFLRMREASLLY